MDKLKLNWYAVCVSANMHYPDKGYTQVACWPVAIRATSLEEAIGIGLLAIKEQRSDKDGWYGHQSAATEIPRRQWEDEENATTNDDDL